MRLELVIRIIPGGEPLTVGELRERLPGLELGVSESLERSEVSFGGRIVVEREADDCEREVARQLAALRQLSTERRGVAITITALPDGGVLRLENGSFGDDEDELAAILGELAGERRSQVYVSFRIEADAHPHLVQLVERSIPWCEPVVESSPASLAIGFAVDGDDARLANLIGALRLAWRQEGSECECLLEIEGERAFAAVVRTWAEWVEFERSIRRSPAVAQSAGDAGTEEERRVALADLPETRRVLPVAELSWIDAEEQILCIADGKLFALSERIEAGTPEYGAIRRRTDDSLYFRGARVVEIPPCAAGSERRIHEVHASAALFSDSSGSADNARTSLWLASDDGISEGPTLTRVRAIDVCEGDVFALADGRSGTALFAIDHGRGWSHAEGYPWHADDVPTDLAVIGSMRVAVTVVRGARTALYLVERANLTHARQIALPCAEPQIVAYGQDSLWLTGMSQTPGPRRCDLFHVNLVRGAVTVVTAELADVPTIDVAASVGAQRLLLATPRAVFATDARAGLREILELAGDETVTGMACGETSAVFVRGHRSSRLVLGRSEVSVPLQLPGYAPRFST